MFKKRISVFAVLFSFFLIVLLGGIVIKEEINASQGKKEQAENIIQKMKNPDDVIPGWVYICLLKKNSFLPINAFVNEIIGKVNFQKRNDVYYWKKNNKLCELNSTDVARMPDLASRISTGEFVKASAKDALSFYQKQMLGIEVLFPGFSLGYYLVKLLLVLGISSIPLLLGFLFSFLTIFSIPTWVVVVSLLFFMIVRVQAKDDTIIIKLMTSSTGDKCNLTLGMLYLADKTGGLIILPEKGIQLAYGPVWKFSKGMISFPIGVICGKGENGVHVEYLSLWSIFNTKIGKFNHSLMGSYNHPLIENCSPFSSFKETLFCTVSKFQLGVRINYLFKKVKKWETKISIGPALQLLKEKFIFHLYTSLTRPYTIKAELQISL